MDERNYNEIVGKISYMACSGCRYIGDSDVCLYTELGNDLLGNIPPPCGIPCCICPAREVLDARGLCRSKKEAVKDDDLRNNPK